jgi:hypothetical protein
MPDKLEMIASLVDKVSGPTDKMARGFGKLNQEGKKVNEGFLKWERSVRQAQTTYAKHDKAVISMHREFRALDSVIGKINPSFGELTRSVGAFGLGAGTLVGTLGAVGVAIYETTKKVSEFAEQMRDLKFGSRESGFSPGEISKWKLVGNEIGVAVEKVQSSLSGLSDVMGHIRTHDKGTLESLMPVAGFTQKLLAMGRAGEHGAKALEEVLNISDKMKKSFGSEAEGIQHAKHFLELVGVDPSFANATREERQKALATAEKFGPSNDMFKPVIKDAERLNEELGKTAAIFESWKVAIQGGLLPPVTELVKSLNNMMQGQHGGLGKSYSDWVNSQVRPKPFALGGIVDKPTIGLLGESGPEAVVPLTGGGYDPFARMRAMIEAVFGDAGYSSMGGVSGARGAFRGGGGGGAALLGGLMGGGRGVGGGARSVGGGGHFGGGGATGAFKGATPGLGPAAEAPSVSSPNAGLSEQRARMMKELADNPKLRDYAIDAMKHEGGIQSNFEQLMNMASMRHQTIQQALHSGQYGPVKRGEVTGNISAATRAAGLAALARVGAGSNITDYATDQGMRGDPNFAKYMANREHFGMHKVEGAWFSAHGEPGVRWAQQQREADQRRAMDESNKQTVEGTGRLDVKVSAPPGTEVKAQGGGLFKDTVLERNVQMPSAASGPREDLTK